jgi:hypothetical protein
VTRPGPRPRGVTAPLQSPLVRTLLRPLVRTLAALALVAGAGVAALTVGSPGGGPVSASAALGAGGEFHPLTPVRVLDTRNAIGVPGTSPMSAASLLDVQLLERPGLPTDNVLAFAVNVTVVGPSNASWLRVFGSGRPEGGSSLVNFDPGEIVPNSAIVTPGANGALSIRLDAGTAHVIVDVFGWFSTNAHPTNGARLVPSGPGRVYDSRNPPYGPDPVTSGETVSLQMRGIDAFSPAIGDIVPNDPSVVGVLVNVTGVNARANSRDTYVSVLPDPVAPGTTPATSNLNLRRGQVKPNLVLVPLGADGRLHFYNFTGETDLVIDVVAYLQTGRPVDTRLGRVIPLEVPYRAFDTRQPSFGRSPLGPGRGEDWSFSDFVASVNIGGESVGPQSALIGNLTGTDLTKPLGWYTPVFTDVRVYPTPPGGGAAPPPEISNLNLVEGVSVPNMALMSYGADHQVRVYNYNGFVQYLLDVFAVVLAD